MDVIRAGLMLAVSLWGTVAQTATAGPEPTHMVAVSSVCTTKMGLGQAHAGLDRSIVLAGRPHPGLDDYLALHAQAREAIQRPGMLPGAELRAQASRAEHPQQ